MEARAGKRLVECSEHKVLVVSVNDAMLMCYLIIYLIYVLL